MSSLFHLVFAAIVFRVSGLCSRQPNYSSDHYTNEELFAKLTWRVTLDDHNQFSQAMGFIKQKRNTFTWHFFLSIRLQFNITMKTLPKLWLFVFVKCEEFIATTAALTATGIALTVALNAIGQNPGPDSHKVSGSMINIANVNFFLKFGMGDFTIIWNTKQVWMTRNCQQLKESTTQ